MFETKTELDELQHLMEESFERAGERMFVAYDVPQQMSAGQLAGFSGIRLVAVASVNRKGEPRVSPRGAAFLHGKFYLAANTESMLVKRLERNPTVAITYYEAHMLVMGHATVEFLGEGSAEFKRVAPEWIEAFRGGRDALRGIDVLLKVNASHLVAFAQRPERYPSAWGGKKK